MKWTLLTSLILFCATVHAEEEKSFHFKATATGIGPTAQIEFILIAPNSGHDYEAIAISTLNPDEIYQELIDLGAEPGWTVNQNELKFYPRGERLAIEFSWQDQGTNHSVSAHKLIVDETHGGYFPEDYFLFAGSTWTTNNGVKTLSATVNDPGSILSTYNSRETLLDRPVRASKGIVYGTLFANPDYLIPEGTEIDVTLRRIALDERLQPVEANLMFNKNTLKVDFNEFSGTLEIPAKEDFLNAVSQWKQAYPEVGLNPNFDSRLPLKDLQRFSSWLAVAEEKEETVILPVSSENLFFRTFLPPPAFKDPARRPSQPWEIKLSLNEMGGITPFISRYIIKSRDLQGEPVYEEMIAETSSIEEWASDLELKVYDPPVVLIHAPAEMTYGELLERLSPLREIFDTYYIFL